MRLLSSYERNEHPVSTLVLECVLWMICSPYMEYYGYNSDGTGYEAILNGLISILNEGHGLNDPETVHVLCQILNRLIVSMSTLINHSHCPQFDASLISIFVNC